MHRKFLEGYWESSVDFCKKSDLQSAQTYISYDDDNQCWMYILLNSHTETKLNICVPIKICQNLLNNILYDNIEFTISSEEDISPLPQTMKCRVNINNGIIVLYQDDIIQLELFKNNKASLGLF